MASWYTQFIAKVVFPLHERLKKHNTVAVFQQLEKSQWQDVSTLKQQQAQKMHNFMQSVYEHVPYYRQLMQQSSLTAADFTQAADIAKLPFLTKQIITEHFTELSANNASGLKRFNTGGSSGKPLIFLLGNERVSHDVAEKWRATRWWGVDIGDKEIVAWGSPIELNAQDKVRIWRDKLFRSTLIPAFDMSEQKLLNFLKTIQQIKPKMLFGYPSVFHLLAKTAQQHNIDMTDLGIKAVFVTSERLYPYQRELISAVFAAPVANGYGGRDAGFIAHECPHGSMHLSFEDIIVEIIDSDGQVLPDGQSGEIVVTHLATSEFPFIRYKTGDIGTLSTKPCSCGRGLPVLEAIEGRSTDFVVASDGTMMHGLSLIYILRDIPGVEAFKIEQQSLTLTEVQVVWPERQLPEAIVNNIINDFKARLGKDVYINVQLVDTIAAEKSGKFRYVISRVVS